MSYFNLQRRGAACLGGSETPREFALFTAVEGGVVQESASGAAPLHSLVLLLVCAGGLHSLTARVWEEHNTEVRMGCKRYILSQRTLKHQYKEDTQGSCRTVGPGRAHVYVLQLWLQGRLSLLWAGRQGGLRTSRHKSETHGQTDDSWDKPERDIRSRSSWWCAAWNMKIKLL